MPVLHSPDSAYAQERVKWEAERSEYGAAGRRYVRHDFPMMMHKAGRVTSPGGAPQIDETHIVESDVERQNMLSRGFRDTPLEALAVLHQADQDHAELHANRVFNDQGMSDRAKAEADRADAASGDHVPAVPVTPIKPKAAVTVKAGA